MASARGFNITPSSSFKRASLAATTVNIVQITQAVTATVAAQFLQPMRDSAKAAGADKGSVAAIAVHKVTNSNDLVMRQQGQQGDITVGISGHSPHADKMDELEWGGISESPRAWVRNFEAHNAREVNDAWSNALTNELNRRLK